MEEAFKRAELDPHTDPAWAHEKITQLRPLLLDLQYERLEKADQTLLVVVAGMDGVGKGSAVNTLNTWLDPRHVHTLAFGEPTQEETMRPVMWRYWNALPAKGQTGLVFGSWYAALMQELQSKKTDADKVRLYADLIAVFEAHLAYQGVQVLKLWFHSSAQAQAARCEQLLSNPDTAWRVSKADLKVQKKFTRIRNAALHTIDLTHRTHAPWVMVPSADPATRDLTVAQALLAVMKSPILPNQVQAPPALGITLRDRSLRISDKVAKKSELDKEVYEKELLHWQSRLSMAVRSKAFRSRSLLVLFEGEDAAGKGGAIRRLTAALDVRHYDVHPIAAPDAFESSRPYLWRFWKRLPRYQQVAIFDRSWYGRVLVERVEKLTPVSAWRRAYDEINSFEAQLVANGTVVIKFWLAISKDEQLRRFKEREASPFKAYKITPDDWRNRAKWNAYRRAAHDMFMHTDTEFSGWHIVAENDKRRARLQVLQTVVEQLEGLGAQAESKAIPVEPDLTLQFIEQV